MPEFGRHESLEEFCNEIAFLPITYHPIVGEEARIVEIALSLSRRSAYDAAYLALAESLKAEWLSWMVRYIETRSDAVLTCDFWSALSSLNSQRQVWVSR